MVLVLEPAIWDEGHSGYRAEDIFVVTDDGCRQLSHYPYTPFSDEPPELAPRVLEPA